MHWNVTWLLFVTYTLQMAVEIIPWGTRVVLSKLVTFIAYVEYLKIFI